MYLTNYRQPVLRKTWIFTQLLCASSDAEEVRKREKWNERNRNKVTVWKFTFYHLLLVYNSLNSFHYTFPVFGNLQIFPFSCQGDWFSFLFFFFGILRELKKRRTFLSTDKTDLKSIKKILQKEWFWRFSNYLSF